MKSKRRKRIKTVGLEFKQRIVEYTWRDRRCHENTLKYIKEGLHWRTMRNVKRNEFNILIQSREVSEETKKLQNSVIWEKRKKFEENAERSLMPEGTRPIRKIRRRIKDNIKMDVDWIPLA
jgi:hypothetical protein